MKNLLLPVNSKNNLSFKPSFKTGIPLRQLFILTNPIISDLSIVPLFEIYLFEKLNYIHNLIAKSEYKNKICKWFY